MKPKITARLLLAGSAAAVAMLAAVLLLASPSKTFVLHDGTKIVVKLPGGFAPLRSSTYRVIVSTPGHPDARVDLYADFDHHPIAAIYPAEDAAFWCLYECDVCLRLVKLDTRRRFEPLGPTSPLNYLVRSSALKVEEATLSDWKTALTNLERMSPKDFRRHCLPGLDAGVVRVYPSRDLLLPRLRTQVEDISAGRSPFPS